VTDLLAAIFVAFNYEKYIAVLSHPQTGPQPGKNFGGAKSLLATIMTSSMCSQP